MSAWPVFETAKALPEKPGIAAYEQIPCLVFVRGQWELCVWNCEHLCWDDSEGDDFRYDPRTPSHWTPLPPNPVQP
jgi:hypothetical protein